MSAVVATVVAALSALAAIASVFFYVYFGRRSEVAAAGRRRSPSPRLGAR
jgi:hypothetical protein